MLGRTNVNNSSNTGDKSIIIATGPSGSTVTCAKDLIKHIGIEKPLADRPGYSQWIFKNLENGEWTISANKGEERYRTLQLIDKYNIYRISLIYRDIPFFTYKDGEYQIEQKDGTLIGSKNTNEGSEFDNYKGDWKIKFLTTGILKITSLKNINSTIDIFSVGGGASGSSRSSSSGHYGAGGGSGYTKILNNFKINLNQLYQINIGGGGSSVNKDAQGKAGGATSAFDLTAPGGKPGPQDPSTGERSDIGGDGGSGGGGYNDGKGGTDGNNGTGSGGIGQRNNLEYGYGTREFNELDGKLYAKGGDFKYAPNKMNENNSGNGGNGSQGGDSQSGGSGIVIIRNHREVS